MTRNIPLSPDDIARWLDLHDKGPALVVLPSTRATVDAVLGRKNQVDTLVIADPALIASALDPARYLATCRQAAARGEPVPNAYTFTDQFVDAPFATLLIQHEGRQQFMPATEVVAQTNYAVNVHVWTDTGFIFAPATQAKNPALVLRALVAYYHSCERLGGDWSMRARQQRREPRARLNSAARRLRMYESLIMQAFTHDTLHDYAQVLMRDLGARRSAVMGDLGALEK